MPTPEDKLDTSNPPKKCNVGIDIESIYVLDLKDCVFDKNGVLVRIKRKYGKFKRQIYKFDNK